MTMLRPGKADGEADPRQKKTDSGSIASASSVNLSTSYNSTDDYCDAANSPWLGVVLQIGSVSGATVITAQAQFSQDGTTWVPAPVTVADSSGNLASKPNALPLTLANYSATGGVYQLGTDYRTNGFRFWRVVAKTDSGTATMIVRYTLGTGA